MKRTNRQILGVWCFFLTLVLGVLGFLSGCETENTQPLLMYGPPSILLDQSLLPQDENLE